MPYRSRSLLLALLGVSYVLVAAMRSAGGREWGFLVLLALPPLLLLVWAHTVPPARGEDWVSPVTRSAARTAAFGGALLVAARVAPPDTAPFDAIAALATATASTAALVAVAHIVPLGGLMVPPRRTKRLWAAGSVAFSGIAATAVALTAAAQPDRPFSPAHADAAIALSAMFALVATIASTWLLRRLRRLDLGASERLSAAFAFAWVALVVGVPASLLRVAPMSHVLTGAAWLAAFTTTLACLARDPTTVDRAQRTLVAVTLVATPVGLFVASVAAQVPREAPLIGLVAITAGVVIGLFGRAMAIPLGPEQSRWLEAVRSATGAAPRAEPSAALDAILTTLRQGLGPTSESAELWQLDPPARITVDRAGYPHSEPGMTFPQLLLELAQAEPEQTVRTAVLEALEVRRPDVRPALEWLRDRGALSLTLLTEEEGPIGALLLPGSQRSAPLSLEEVRALRALADRMTSLMGVASALTRAQAREVDAQKKADSFEDRALYVEHLLASGQQRHEAFGRKLARTALLAPYSPAARLSVEELERLGKAGAPVSLLTPPGIDPVPYAAVVHRASSRRGGPFVVVDAANSDEQRAEAWIHPTLSPLCLADGGTLVVISIAALSIEAQREIARALVERRSPAGHPTPLEVSLVVSVSTTVDVLVATGRLDPLLADRLGDRSVPLPPLGLRAEDLRAILVDRLARLGVHLRGQAMGLDPRALGRLIEHGWPGNEVELEDVLTRAVGVAEGDVITVAHLDQIGFVATPPALRRGSRPPGPGQHSLRS
jgi:transcriptional regulator with GAF, ATPase, and Fis domain